MNRISKITATAMVALAAASPAAALAQSPADEVYNPGGGVLDVVESGSPTPAPTPAPETTAAPETETAPETTTSAPSTSEAEAPATTQSTPAATATPTTETQQATTGDLPFTGFEAGFVALAGLALLGGGIAMRRATRNQS